MTLPEFFRQNFLSLPGLEEVYYTSVQYEGQQFSIPTAKRSKITAPPQQINSNFLSNVDTCVWHIPNWVLIPALETEEDDYEGVFDAQYNDEISAVGGTWLVISAELCSQGTRWKLFCTRKPDPPAE